MSYMEEVLELIGLKEGDRFHLRGNNNEALLSYGDNISVFIIKDNEIITKDNPYLDQSLWIGRIVSGSLIVKKLPWKPKDGETYWYVCVDGDIECGAFSYSSLADLAKYKMGNCFPTYESALYEKFNIIMQFDKIRQELEEDN